MIVPPHHTPQCISDDPHFPIAHSLSSSTIVIFKRPCQLFITHTHSPLLLPTTLVFLQCQLKRTLGPAVLLGSSLLPWSGEIRTVMNAVVRLIVLLQQLQVKDTKGIETFKLQLSTTVAYCLRQ